MTRIQSQPGLRQSTARLRLPSEFIPSSRQVFADRAPNPTRFLTQATASALSSAAGLAVTLSGNSEQAMRSDFETTQARVARLQGQLQRTNVDDPEYDKLTSELETLDERATRRFTGTQFEAESVGMFERTRTDVFVARQRAAEAASKNARLAAAGQFRRQITEHVRDLSLNQDVMQEYLSTPADLLDDAVEQDFLSALPDDIRDAVLDDPQLIEEFYSQRDRFVSNVDRMRIDAEQRADNLLAEQAERELQFSFSEDPDFGLTDFLSQVPEGRTDEYLSNLTGYLKSTLSVPTDSPDALTGQRIAATKAEQLVDYYASNGRSDLAEGLTDGLRAYYSNTSKLIAGTFLPDYEGEVTEEFIAAYEQHALRETSKVLQQDLTGYESVEEMRTIVGPGSPESKMLDNLVAHRKFLDRQLTSRNERSDSMQALIDGTLTPGRATPDLHMVNYTFSNPEDALEIIFDRAVTIADSLPEGSPEAGYLQESFQTLNEAATLLRDPTVQQEDKALAIARLSAVGAYTDGRMNAEGKHFSTTAVAREMVDQIGDGQYLGIFQSLAYMRGLGESQVEFLGVMFDEGEGDIASALARLSRVDISGYTPEQVEQEFQQFVTEREELMDRINFGDRDVRDSKRVGDYVTNKKFVAGIADRVGGEYNTMSPEAEATLRFLTLPDQIDNLRLAGESVFDRVNQTGFDFYVDDDDVLRVVKDSAGPNGHATPVYLNVQPRDLTKAVLRDTEFSRAMGGVLSDGESFQTFRDALPEFLMDRRPGALVDNQGRVVSDKDMLQRMLNEALNEGLLEPRFEYNSGGVSAFLRYTPADKTSDGRPFLADPFNIPLPNFHWDSVVGPNWRKAREPLPQPTSLSDRLTELGVGEGLGGADALAFARGETPRRRREPDAQLNRIERIVRDRGGRLYE